MANLTCRSAVLGVAAWQAIWQATGLGLKQPAVLGHSMGAVTALGLAGAHPDLPGAILLEDPPPWWMPDPPGGRPTRPDNSLVDLKRKTREELIAYQHAHSPTWSEAELGPWADSKLRFSFDFLSRKMGPPGDWPTMARRVTCPTLLITADADKGAIVPPGAATVFRDLVPQAKVVHIAGAGHSIRREQFTRYMDVVTAFLTETNV